MKKVILLFLMSVVCFWGVSADGSDWIFLGKNSLGTTYYDKDSVKQLAGNIVRVSVKIVYSSEGVREARESFSQVDPAEPISYTLYVYEVNCSQGSCRLLKASTHNSSDTLINGTELDYLATGLASWEIITPNSRMALLSEESCKYQLYDHE